MQTAQKRNRGIGLKRSKKQSLLPASRITETLKSAGWERLDNPQEDKNPETSVVFFPKDRTEKVA